MPSFFSGGEVTKKLKPQIEQISLRINDILRRALRKILSDPNLVELFEGKQEAIDLYFESLIFGNNRV